MGNPFDSGAGNDGGMQRVVVPRTNQQRRDLFSQNYNRAFDGNDRFKESLSGFYGGQPFSEVAARVAQQNAFQRPERQFRLVPKGGDGGIFADSMVGNPFVPADIQFGMLPLTLF
jgi:hypothetical protein